LAIATRDKKLFKRKKTIRREVREMTEEPDYESVLAAVKKATAS
jgi:hypothetical protein